MTKVNEMARARTNSASSGPEFNDDTGWTQLRGFLPSDEVSQVQAICDGLLALPLEQRRAGDKPVAGTHHLVGLDDRSELIAAVLERDSLTTLISDILGESWHRAQAGYRSPQPGFGGQSLHADAIANVQLEPARVATAIIALSDFTVDNGCTRLVPGSHHRPDLQRLSGRLHRHSEQVMLTGTAGTAFVFSGHVLHSGTVNQSGDGRPALQIIWRVGPPPPRPPVLPPDHKTHESPDQSPGIHFGL